MAKVFYPIGAPVFIAASNPHPANTQYRLAIGEEDWGDEKRVPVVKIQMVYDGKVSGRRAPSFPLGSDDAYRVMVQISNMIASNPRS